MREREAPPHGCVTRSDQDDVEVTAAGQAASDLVADLCNHDRQVEVLFNARQQTVEWLIERHAALLACLQRCGRGCLMPALALLLALTHETERTLLRLRLARLGAAGSDGCSNGAHLWWSGGQQPGDTLVLGFNVAKAGFYQVSAQLLKAVDYGIAQLSINDVKLGDPIDFYHESGVEIGPPRALGTLALRAGENTLSFTIIGANPKAMKSYMIGLDYLLLTSPQ